MNGAPGPWLLRHFAGGYARAQPWRTLIQVSAIAVGVALGYAVELINASALQEYAAAERSLSGDADVTVSGPPAGFDEVWFPRIADDPAVLLAAPVLEVEATVAATASVAHPMGLRILGIDALRSARLEPDLVGVPSDRAGNSRARLLDEGIYLSPTARAQLHPGADQTLELVIGDHRLRLPIAGDLPAARDAIASMDLGFAQWRLQRLGKLTRIDVKFAPGVDAAAAQRAWELPPDLRIQPSSTAVRRREGLSRAYRVNLQVLAMVALFTGAFLVFSLQSQAIVARRSSLALLRMLGATRGQLGRMLLFESLAFGAVGSLLGLAAGAALAAVALRTLGGDLGGGYFAGIRPSLTFDTGAAALYFTFGLLAAVAGTWLPAREASAQAPAPALKAGVDPGPGSQRPRPWTALVGFALACALLALPPWRGIPLGAYLAIAALLTATIALKPFLAPLLFEPLAGWVSGRARLARHAPAWLAATRLARLPRFAAVGAAGIVASFALMVAMATMVDSFRSSFDIWLARMLPADLYARAAPAGTTGRFSVQDLERMRTDPAVLRMQYSRIIALTLDPARAPVALIARGVDRAQTQSSLPLVGSEFVVGPHQVPVWVSEAMVDLYRAQPGTTLQLPLGGALVAVTIAGIWRDYVRQGGSIVMAMGDYERLSGDYARTDAALWLRADAAPQAVAQRLLAGLESPAVQIVSPGQVRELSLRLFDRSFKVTYLIQWAAVAIGLAGLATTFSAQALARTREFGMLRHLGVTRRQVLALLAAEALLVTLLAAILGLGAGLGIAAILVEVVNPQSFHWTMELRVPAPLLAALALALLAGAVLASTIAGRRALSVETLSAVKDDW